MLKPFTDENEIVEIVRAFEACAYAPNDFHHREHLAVALWYCRHYPEAEAENQMRAGLQRFLTHLGLTQGYHETITLFWVRLINYRVRDCGTAAEWLACANRLLADSGEAQSIHRYYMADTLASEDARLGWVAPDLQPLADS